MRIFTLLHVAADSAEARKVSSRVQAELAIIRGAEMNGPEKGGRVRSKVHRHSKEEGWLFSAYYPYLSSITVYLNNSCAEECAEERTRRLE